MSVRETLEQTANDAQAAWPSSSIRAYNLLQNGIHDALTELSEVERDREALKALMQKCYLDGCIEACGEPHRHNWNGWWAMFGESLCRNFPPEPRQPGSDICSKCREHADFEGHDGFVGFVSTCCGAKPYELD